MRPGQNQNQNRRMRGRNRNNKGPNPLTRSYDSNGPDVKIRGTAQHIADKYTQLARDAQVSGDPVAAESYFQHAEHYYRIIAAAQEQFRPAFNAYPRPYDDGDDEGDEEGGGFGYGQADRPAQGGFGAQNGAGAPGDEDFGSQPQPFEGRNEGGQRFDRGNRPDRGDRYERGGDRQERGQERGDRFDRGERRDRFARNDRPDRNGERPFDRQPRGEFQPRPEQGPRAEGPRLETRPDPAPREDGPRRERQPEEGGAENAGLPAFLTNPARPAISVVEPAPEPSFAGPDEAADAGAAEANGRFPRRRRRRRIEASDGAPGGEGTDTAAE